MAVSDPKETHFFSTQYDRGLEWYRSQFSFEGSETLLDGSTSYTMANFDCSYRTGVRADVARRIFRARPDARFIYILRDPVERTISAYWHSVRFASERRSLRDAIAENPAYIWTGQYHRQLQRYLDHFHQDAFLLIDFRDLERDPIAVARKATRFLGLDDENTKFDLGEPKNRGFQLTPLGRAVGAVFGGDIESMKAPALAMRRLFPAPIYRAARQLLITDLETVSTDDRAWLREFFREDAEAIRKLAGIALLTDES